MADFELLEYSFDDRLLRDKTVAKYQDTLKDISVQCVSEIENNVKAIHNSMQTLQTDVVFDRLMQTQQLAIDFGTLLEQAKGEEHQGVKSIVS